MPMPDTPALAALRVADRHAENEVLHLALRLANWDPPSVMDLTDAPLLEAHARALAAYRDAVAARVRAEEAEKRAGETRAMPGLDDLQVRYNRALPRGCVFAHPDTFGERGAQLIEEFNAKFGAALPPEGDHA